MSEDPNIRINSYEQDVQTAIRSGKISLGMTKEQVIMSLGYPRSDETPSLLNTEWKYWTADWNEFLVVWGDDDRVKDVITDDETKETILASSDDD